MKLKSMYFDALIYKRKLKKLVLDFLAFFIFFFLNQSIISNKYFK